MTTYYVRATGSDGAAGTSAGTAWLTIGKALGAAGIASGDTVYVGAGDVPGGVHGRDDVGDRGNESDRGR